MLRSLDPNWVIAIFTCVLTVISFVQWRASHDATRAATRSADLAEVALRVLNQPWLDTANWKVTEQRGPDIDDHSGGQMPGPLAGFAVSFDVENRSHTPATIHHLEVTDIAADVPVRDWTSTSHVATMITPGGTCPYTVAVTGLSAPLLAAYERGEAVEVRVTGIIHFSDPFTPRDPNVIAVDGPRRRFFGRHCLLRRYHAPEFTYAPGLERMEPPLSAPVSRLT